MSRLLSRKTAAQMVATVVGVASFAVVATPSLVSAASTVSGTVFHDFDSDGVMDTVVASGTAVDVGVSGIEVRAFDSTGASVGDTTTSNDGTYSLPVTSNAGDALRIEFTIPSTHPLDAYRDSFAGTNSGTSIQFVSAGATDVDYAIAVPGEYCQSNPYLAVSRLCSGAGTDVNASPTVFVTRYDSGPYTPAQGFSNIYTNWDATAAGTKTETGSILGLAWDPATQRIYNSAYIRRHAEMYEVAGKPVPGALFVTTPNGSSSDGDTGGGTEFLVDLETLLAGDQFSNSTAGALGFIPANVDRKLQYLLDGADDGGADNDGVDSDFVSGQVGIYEEVGQTGIGDIETDGNGHLYVVSLYDKNLYKVTLPEDGSAPTAMTSLGDITNGVTCTNGTGRPFGITRWRGALYLGMTCDGSGDYNTSSPGDIKNQNITFLIRRYELTTNTWSTFFGPQPLTMTKGSADGTSGNWQTSRVWNPWTNSYASHVVSGADANGVRPVPMFSDIEFDKDGSIIVGFRDRNGDQLATNGAENPRGGETSYPAIASGDVYRICRTGDGYSSSDYTFEGGSGCPQTVSGTGGNEYYNGDKYFTYHYEVSVGMMDQVPGFPDLILNVFDPYDGDGSGKTFYSGGTRYLDNATGDRTSEFPNEGSGVLFYANAISGNPNTDGGFLKTNGMSDVEALCDMAPVQIGNRLWSDDDKDGIQDADETPIVGVTVRLYASDGTTLLGTAITNDKGEYYFSSNVTEDVSGNGDNSGGGVTVGESFVVKLDLASDFADGGALHECTLTSTDSMDTESALDDAIDNDAVIDGDAWVITTQVTKAGENNHTYDFGCYKTIPVTPPAETAPPTESTVPTQTTPPVQAESVQPIVESVSVGDYVWRDWMGDGYQGRKDNGIAGAKLSIRTVDGKRVYDINGKLVKPIVTKKDGKYLFTKLPPGQYVVSIRYPKGFKPTTKDRPVRATNSSSFRETSRVLKGGESDLTLDFGVVGMKPARFIPRTR